MCLPFFHEYKIVDGWHGTNIMGGAGTCLEKVCKKCGKYSTQIVPGYVDIENITKNIDFDE